MGMFDWIRCECSLPDGFTKTRTFQTKDLYCTMETYVITAMGRLVRDKAKSMRWAEEMLNDKSLRSFHGIIEFYNSNICAIGCGVYATHGDGRVWSRTYEAIFTRGSLVRIKLMSTRTGMGRLRHVKERDIQRIWEESKRHMDSGGVRKGLPGFRA